MYRARKNQDNKLFLNAKDLWYPPSHCVEKLGRLNDIGESKFYASSMPNTTILELKPAIGDVYTIISAKTHDDNIKSIKIAFIGIERSKSFDTKHLTQNDMLRYSKNFRKTIGESNYKKWIAVDDYLSQILAIPILDGEEHKYKPSVAFAKLLAGCYGHKAA